MLYEVITDMGVLEDCVREDLNERAPRAMADRVAALLSGATRLDPSYKRDRLMSEFDQAEMVRAQERLYEELLARKGFPCP